MKKQDFSFVKWLTTRDVEKIVDPSDKSQESSDFVYLSEDQTDTTIKITDTSLSENKIMPQLKTLKKKKVYDLKFVNNHYEFKIEISETNLRNNTTMSTTTWMWIIFALAAIIIVAAIWYYAMQGNDRD